MAKSKYPIGFSAYNPPRFYLRKPSKLIPAYTELTKDSLSDGQELILDSEMRYKISLDHDYCGCYYPGDIPSIEANLIGFSEEDIENPNYDSELRKYNRVKAKHKEELEVWNKWKTIWDTEQAKNKEANERKQLEDLKKKYEQ